MAGEQLHGGGQILDVGCGGGWLLDDLSQRGVAAERLHGADLIESRVEAARKRVPGADIRFADARALPFEDGRFDSVTLLTTLSSMPESSIGPALKETRRVLSPSGVVLCYEPRIANPFNRSTVTISPEILEHSLGPAASAAALTGFPPLARRLGRLTPRLYPALARLAPTHRITIHEPGAVPRRPG